MGAEYMGSQASSAGLTEMPDNPEIWKAAAMADQFDKMQKLPDPLPGAPNFHRIPGYKVYTTGQPTLEGIKNVLEKVTGTIYRKDGPIIWLNLRPEPDVYVNGEPICARPPNKIGEYAELGAVTRDIIKADEAEFFKVVEGRVKENGGKLKYVTITKEEKEVEVKELKTLSEAMEAAKADFPGLVHWRVPVCNSASPLETDFDIICNTPASQGPPQAALLPASSRSSRSTLPSKDLSKLCPVWTLTCSGWTSPRWTLPRTLCSVVS